MLIAEQPDENEEEVRPHQVILLDGRGLDRNDQCLFSQVKLAMEELEMVIAIEEGSFQFRLVNVNERTEPILSALELEEYLLK